jgi:hypothetical protein
MPRQSISKRYNILYDVQTYMRYSVEEDYSSTPAIPYIRLCGWT